MVARIDAGSWQAPPVFLWLYEAGRMTPEEMLRVFNCGIGMVLVVAAEYADAVTRHLSEQGETVYRLGELVPGDGPAQGPGRRPGWLSRSEPRPACAPRS